MRIIRSVALGATVALALSACGASGGSSKSAASSSMKMTVGYTAVGAAYSDLYVCQDKGIFKKHGLDVKLTLLNNSSQLTSALASDSVQIGAGVAKTTAASVLKGVDLKYVALPISSFYMEMWGKSSIKSPEDVKGKRIGLSSPGSLGDAAVDAWLKDMGWSDKDVTKVFLKSSPAELTALRKGAVDVIVTQPPRSKQSQSFGATKIMDFTKYPAAANAYTATAEYVAQNKKAVAAFVKSETECLSILHKDKKQAVKSIVKHTDESDKALANYAYNFFEPLWARDPKVNPKLIKTAFEEAAADDGDETKTPDTNKYIDNSFTTKIKKSGYIGSLYK